MTFRDIRIIFLLLAVAVILLLVLPPVLGDPHPHDGNDDGDVISSGDVAGGSVNSSARGYSVGGGDMDIDDCLATHSLLFGLWQGTHTNPYCEALRLDADGKYQAAAEMRCSTHKYRKVYGKGQVCIDAVIRTAPEKPENPGEDDVRFAQQQKELEYVQQQLATVLETVEQRTAAAKSAPRIDAELEALKAREAERELKEEASRAYFRAKYEAAQAAQREQLDET